MAEPDSSTSSNQNTIALAIRLIRSFKHRNIRHFPIRGIDSSGQMTGKELKERILQLIQNEKLPPPFKTFAFDTLKIEQYPHQAKTSDVVSRRDDDEKLIIDDNKRLCDYRIVEGTEIAFFKRSDYEEYKLNPELVLHE